MQGEPSVAAAAAAVVPLFVCACWWVGLKASASMASGVLGMLLRLPAWLVACNNGSDLSRKGVKLDSCRAGARV